MGKSLHRQSLKDSTASLISADLSYAMSLYAVLIKGIIDQFCNLMLDIFCLRLDAVALCPAISLPLRDSRRLKLANHYVQLSSYYIIAG